MAGKQTKLMSIDAHAPGDMFSYPKWYNISQNRGDKKFQSQVTLGGGKTSLSKQGKIPRPFVLKSHVY